MTDDVDEILMGIRESLTYRHPVDFRNQLQITDLFPAGALVILYIKCGTLCVLLQKRTDKVEHHKGEISFPGGAQSSEDLDILQTALRETQEEMGINCDDVEIISRLDQVTTSSGFLITPFVGIIMSLYPFEANPVEVADILEVPIRSLLEQEMVSGNLHTSMNSASYTYEEHVITGATARILKQLLSLINSTV